MKKRKQTSTPALEWLHKHLSNVYGAELANDAPISTARIVEAGKKAGYALKPKTVANVVYGRRRPTAPSKRKTEAIRAEQRQERKAKQPDAAEVMGQLKQFAEHVQALMRHVGITTVHIPAEGNIEIHL